MPGKKRPTSAKQSALSKRHKSGGGSKGGGGTSSSNNGNNKNKPSSSSALNGGGKASTSAFADAPNPRKPFKALDGIKKDKKGKGPAFIQVPGVKPEKQKGDSDNDSEEDEDESESQEEEDDGMEVDEDLMDGEGVEFLTRLDQKGMSAYV